MSKRRNTFTAWGVLWRSIHDSPDEAILVGRYWFGHDLTPHLAGCRISLFKTRKEARAACARRRSWYTRRISPVKVRVSVEVE